MTERVCTNIKNKTKAFPLMAGHRSPLKDRSEKIKEKPETTTDNYFSSFNEDVWAKLHAHGWEGDGEPNRQGLCLQRP